MRRKDRAGGGGRATFSLFGCLRPNSLESADLGRRFKIFQLASGAVFRMSYLSLAVCTAARWRAWTRDGEPTSFRIYSLAVSVHGDLCAFPSGWADSPREINEAARPGRRPGPRDQKSPEISNHFSLFGCLRGGSVECVVPRQRSKIIQLASGAVFRMSHLSLAVCAAARWSA